MKEVTVVLFGHSYVRDIAQLNRFSIDFSADIKLKLKYIHHPGATFKSFLDNRSKLDSLFEAQPQILIVILGGNDLSVDVNLSRVYSDCALFYKLIRKNLPDTCVIAAQIESRFLTRVNRFGTPAAQEFSRLGNYFNRKLKSIKDKNYILIVKGANRLCNPAFYKLDRIHLNNRGIEKYFSLIQTFLLKITGRLINQ